MDLYIGSKVPGYAFDNHRNDKPQPTVNNLRPRHMMPFVVEVDLSDPVLIPVSNQENCVDAQCQLEDRSGPTFPLKSIT